MNPAVSSTLRHWATDGNRLVMSAAESMLSSAALLSVGFTEDTTPEVVLHAHKSFTTGSLIVVLTADGTSANLVAKYRPPSLVVVASTDLTVLRQSAVAFGQVPLKVSLFVFLECLQFQRVLLQSMTGVRNNDATGQVPLKVSL